MIHELKTWPEYFWAVARGDKDFEIRLNDREFRASDEVLLKEYITDAHFETGKYEKQGYTGRILHRRIKYILHGGQFGIEAGYVVMGLEKI